MHFGQWPKTPSYKATECIAVALSSFFLLFLIIQFLCCKIVSLNPNVNPMTMQYFTGIGK